MKTSELTGAALDWAVAKCEGAYTPSVHTDADGTKFVNYGGMFPEWSVDWTYGGPIIEREGISVRYRVGVNLTANIDGKYEQSVPYRQPNAQLTVAMRCYVASKLGDNIDIPEELK